MLSNSIKSQDQALSPHKVVTVSSDEKSKYQIYFLNSALQFLDPKQVVIEEQYILKRVSKAFANKNNGALILIAMITRVNDKNEHYGKYKVVYAKHNDKCSIEVAYVDLSNMEISDEVTLKNKMTKADKEKLDATCDDLAVLPPDLNPINVNNRFIFQEFQRHVENYITQQSLQGQKFCRGHIDIAFHEPLPPNASPNIYDGAQDYTLARAAVMFKDLELLERLNQKASLLAERFNQLNSDANRILDQLIPKERETVKSLQLGGELGSSLSKLQSEITKIKEIVQFGPADKDDISSRWFEAVEEQRLLNIYKRYLAYAIYCAAGQYYQDVVQSDRADRSEKIKNFNQRFKGFVQIEEDGNLTDINLIYDAFEHKSLNEIENEMNALLAAVNTSWGTSSKKLKTLLAELKEISAKLGQPYLAYGKYELSTKWFAWSEKTKDKERLINELEADFRKRVQNIESLKANENGIVPLQSEVDTRANNVQEFDGKVQKLRRYFDYRDKLTVLKQSISEEAKAANIDDILSSLPKLEKQLESMEVLCEKLHEEPKEYKELQQKLSDVKKSFDKLNNAIKRKTKEIDDFNLEIDCKNYKEVEQLSEDLHYMIAGYHKHSYSEAELARAENSIAAVNDKISSIRVRTELEISRLSVAAHQKDAKSTLEALKRILDEIMASEEKSPIINNRSRDSLAKLTKDNIGIYESSYNSLNKLMLRFQNKELAEIEPCEVEEIVSQIQLHVPTIRQFRESIEKDILVYKEFTILKDNLSLQLGVVKDYHENIKEILLANYTIDSDDETLLKSFSDSQRQFLDRHQEIENFKLIIDKKFSVYSKASVKEIKAITKDFVEKYRELTKHYFLLKNYERYAILQSECKLVKTKLDAFSNFFVSNEESFKKIAPEVVDGCYSVQRNELQECIDTILSVSSKDLATAVDSFDDHKNRLFNLYTSYLEYSTKIHHHIVDDHQRELIKGFIEACRKDILIIDACDRESIIYHRDLQDLQQKFSYKKFSIESKMEVLERNDLMPDYAIVQESICKDLSGLKELSHQMKKITQPNVPDIVADTEYANNRRCLKNFYELLCDAIDMLEAKKFDLENHKSKKTYFRHGLQEKHTIIKDHLNELVKLRVNIESYAQAKGKDIKTLRADVFTKSKKMDVQPSKKNLRSLKQAQELYVEAFQNESFKIDQAQLSIRLHSYHKTVNSFELKMNNHLQRWKDDCKRHFLGGVRYWLSRFHERFVDGMRAFFDQHTAMNKYVNFSTVGTSKVLKEETSKRLGFFARKFNINASIPEKDMEPQIKPMVLSPRTIRE